MGGVNDGKIGRWEGRGANRAKLAGVMGTPRELYMKCFASEGFGDIDGNNVNAIRPSFAPNIRHKECIRWLPNICILVLEGRCVCLRSFQCLTAIDFGW